MRVDLPDFPSCSNVFGYPPVFPHSSNLLAGERYAFNCPGAKIPSRDKKSCVCPPNRPEKSDGTCTEIVSVSFPPPANGTLSAESEESAVYNGDVVKRGATVTFTAAPNDGWQVSIWTGDCADAAGKFCAVAATLNVSVGVEFSDIDECEAETDNCAAVGGRCDNTEGKFICSCVSGYSGDGVTCNAHKTVSFPPVENGNDFRRRRGNLPAERRHGSARDDDNFHRRAGSWLPTFHLVRRLRRRFRLRSRRDDECQRQREFHRC